MWDITLEKSDVVEITTEKRVEREKKEKEPLLADQKQQMPMRKDWDLPAIVCIWNLTMPSPAPTMG